ncbi:MAG: AAA family ATPase, partial [Nitrososphaeraceae archaeon]|nr:AAA family ATPase [Nitrososphaeraceae archaeon]
MGVYKSLIKWYISNVNQRSKQMKFNHEQQLFYDTAIDLNYSRIFLKGEAGTGKTYLICEIAKYLAANGLKVAFASPTHQALHVIREKLGSVNENITTLTMASLLGRAMLRGTDGTMFSLRPGIKRLSAYDVIICDEMSMAGDSEVSTFLA